MQGETPGSTPPGVDELPGRPSRGPSAETRCRATTGRHKSPTGLDTDGRAYYRRKRAESKRPMEAIRCLKRRISDAIYRQLITDAAPQRANAGPGGHCGASHVSSAAGSIPHTGTSDQPLPGPATTTLRPTATRGKTKPRRHLDATG